MKKLLGAFLFCFLLLAGANPSTAFQLPGAPSLPQPAEGTLEQERYLESLLPPEKFKIKKEDDAAPGEKTGPEASPPAASRPLNYGDDAFLESLMPPKAEANGENKKRVENSQNSENSAIAPPVVYAQDAFLESLIADELKVSGDNKAENGSSEQNGEFDAAYISQESFLDSLLTQNKFQMGADDAASPPPEIVSRTQAATQSSAGTKMNALEVLSRPFRFNIPLQDFLDIQAEYPFWPAFEQNLMQFSSWKVKFSQTKVLSDEISPQILGYLAKVRTDGNSIQILQDNSSSSLMTMDFSPASETERMSNAPMMGGGGGGGSSREYFGRLIKTQILFWGMLLSVLFFMYWNRKIF